MAVDLAHLQQWVGRTEIQEDEISLAPLRAMAATLNRDPSVIKTGSPLPPLWHWLYFQSPAPQSELGPDGHPARGGFLPPVPLPRRMWAGSRCKFMQALKAGEVATCRSTIKSVAAKQGRSGELVFVTVEHQIHNASSLLLQEEQDIVYRDMPAAESQASSLPAGIPVKDIAQFQRVMHPDAVWLFRYSALTFNGHRIHYDRSYVTAVEGYPGLVVHGPLLATLLLDLLVESVPTRQVTSFTFKAIRPVFDTASFTVCGRRADDDSYSLWIQDEQGFLCMQASAS